MSATNTAFSIASGESRVFPMDRWSSPDCTIQFSAISDVNIEGTLDNIHTTDALDVVWNFLWGTWQESQTTMETFDAKPDSVGFALPVHTPLEAIRITANNGDATGRLMQGNRS